MEAHPARPLWQDKTARWIAGAAALTLLCSTAGHRWWTYSRTHVGTDNAYLAGNIHQISSRVAGTVIDVLVTDHQRVSEAAELLKLDPRDFELRVQQARHQIAQASAQRAQAAASLDQAKAQLAQADAKSAKAAAELERARLDYERAQHLTEDGRFAAISKQEFDSTKAAFEVAQASSKVGEADLNAARALVAAAEAAAAVAQAREHTAQVALQDAELQLSYTTIPAPVTGAIGRKAVEIGQHVQPGQALLAVVAEEKWVIANFKETQLAKMRPGQPVSVRLDALPGKVFSGRVESFSPASGAQFALLPPDNATGNFTKVVQRVPVKIGFEPGAIRGFESRIVPGLSAVVEVNLAAAPTCQPARNQR